jgi:hypothetical protein
MKKDYPISGSLRLAAQRPGRPSRPWLWGLACWLKNGSIVVAFFLAVRAGAMGTLALAAFIGGFCLREVLEATSQGD